MLSRAIGDEVTPAVAEYTFGALALYELHPADRAAAAGLTEKPTET